MTTEEKDHAKLGDKIKGAVHVVHGVGENIRGSVIGAADSVKGSDASKAKNEDIVAKGRAEIERGMSQIKGPPTSTSGETQAGGQVETQPLAEKPSEGPPPPQEPAQESVGTESPKGQPVTEPQPTQQEATERTDTGTGQPEISKETQAAPETKETQSGKEGLIGVGADAPQGPGSSV